MYSNSIMPHAMSFKCLSNATKPTQTHTWIHILRHNCPAICCEGCASLCISMCALMLLYRPVCHIVNKQQVIWTYFEDLLWLYVYVTVKLGSSGNNCNETLCQSHVANACLWRLILYHKIMNCIFMLKLFDSSMELCLFGFRAGTALKNFM